MKKPTVSIVVALAKKNRVIGKNNKLPWHIPEDLRHFKQVTEGHPVIMGRKTYESIGRPLPNRTNIVISRNKNYNARGCIVLSSLSESIKLASQKDKEEIFIIGGGQIFEEAIHITDRLYLTLVEGDFDGDVYFPVYESLFTKVISRSEHKSDRHRYTFLTIVK